MQHKRHDSLLILELGSQVVAVKWYVSGMGEKRMGYDTTYT